ncbi:hypothetical protein AAFF_G00334140 [Aldrovandia affinis]|uniref:SET domain-containing protein n=1 Tax=Aldrovandia affinis TaxID=143900 RepID=A0AAD7R6V5_9TELE|nr:hypothetical protein AAFF_G00334140 [Aldrovandia affinis]
MAVSKRVKNAGVGSVEEGKTFLDSATEKQRGGFQPPNMGLLRKELNTYTRGDNLRSRPSVRYTEEEEPRDEDYLYCEECDSFFPDECEVHGPPTFISDSPAPLGAPSRARLTLPLSLEVRVSGIPGAGLGVFNRNQRRPMGVHFGPYEGELTDEYEAIDSGYSWMRPVEERGRWHRGDSPASRRCTISTFTAAMLCPRPKPGEPGNIETVGLHAEMAELDIAAPGAENEASENSVPSVNTSYC